MFAIVSSGGIVIGGDIAPAGSLIVKITKRQLRKIIEESGMAIVQSDDSQVPANLLLQYLGSLRAMQLWFHAAHNLTKGTGFGGDHVNLYGKIYIELQDDFDAAVEKAIGLTNNEVVGCPIEITKLALTVLKNYESPTNMSASKIVTTGLEILDGHLGLLSELFYTLESMHALPLGLNDFLMAAANGYETYVYLLQQRSKGGLD